MSYLTNHISALLLVDSQYDIMIILHLSVIAYVILSVFGAQWIISKIFTIHALQLYQFLQIWYSKSTKDTVFNKDFRSYKISKYLFWHFCLQRYSYYIPRIWRIGGCYGFTSKPPATRNGVNAITQKPRDGLFSNLVYTLVVIMSWPD